MTIANVNASGHRTCRSLTRRNGAVFDVLQMRVESYARGGALLFTSVATSARVAQPTNPRVTASPRNWGRIVTCTYL